MVLHTWVQALQRHPHLHVIVPGGGLHREASFEADDPDSSASLPPSARWVSCPRGFFLPVKVLSRVFRGKLRFLPAPPLFYPPRQGTGWRAWPGLVMEVPQTPPLPLDSRPMVGVQCSLAGWPLA